LNKKIKMFGVATGEGVGRTGLGLVGSKYSQHPAGTPRLGIVHQRWCHLLVQYQVVSRHRLFLSDSVFFCCALCADEVAQRDNPFLKPASSLVWAVPPEEEEQKVLRSTRVLSLFLTSFSLFISLCCSHFLLTTEERVPRVDFTRHEDDEEEEKG
jgi:hypothetical protein